MALQRTTFDPQQHGFRFANYFSFSLDFDLPLVPPIDLGEIIFGLCGGMSFAALDYFHAGIPIPTMDTQPEPGTPLHSYLLRRQIGSLTKPAVPLRILEWMLREDGDIARQTARREFPKVRRRIAKGNPAVLLLLRAGGVSDPTQNHQVVVTGYDLDEGTGQLTLFLYDPNHPEPAEEVQISMTLPSRDRQAVLAQSTGEHLRGFFVLAYGPRKRGLPAQSPE